MPDTLERLRMALAGRYTLNREIGRGGMATVYLAEDLNHARPVALKVLNPELAASIGAERFQREIKLAARLQHPHILSVHDSGEASGLFWFTMPFIEGETLRDRLNRDRQLPVEDAVRIVREAALALDYAHRHGVVHRDIKPENILLSDDQALVADFGIARAVSGGPALTETGMAIGTPAYMSPEQGSGQATVDARSDIYSLGCVLYELLAGEPPFSGPTAQAILVRALTETPRPLATVRTSVSPRLAAAVGKAMARDAADRFVTAAEFAKALGATSGEVVGTGINPATAPSTRRAGLALAIVALLAIGGAGAWFIAGRSRHQGPPRIAVLPFENLGAAEDEFFADGVADEVRTKLASLPGVIVTARGSAAQYKKSSKTPREIGRDLQVDYLLTGTVRWSKTGGTSKVRVTPELTRVSDMSSRWSEQIDADLADVFKVQSNIATTVASKLDVALAAADQTHLQDRPTENLEAYQSFLKGEQATSSLGASDAAHLREGVTFYRHAVELDSNFVEAWAQLARTYSSLYGNGPTKEGVAQAREAADRAMRLAPEHPMSLLARGVFLINQDRDYTGALQYYTKALAKAPRNAVVLTAAAGAERTIGRWDASLAHLLEARKIDPRNVRTARILGSQYHQMRRYDAALAAWHDALALAPDNLAIIQGAADTWLALGRLDSARAVVNRALTIVDTARLAEHFALYQEQMWVLPEAVQPVVTRLTIKDFDGDRGHFGLKIGGTWKLLGNMDKARAYADTARAAFEAQLKEFPEAAQLHELRGRALALGGYKKEAIEEAELSLRLRETVLDATTGPYVKFQVARILIQSGEVDKALDILKPLLTEFGSDITPAYLRLDPTFAPLKGNPRFEQMAGGR